MRTKTLYSTLLAASFISISSVSSAATVPYGVFGKDDGKNKADTISILTDDEVMQLAKVEGWDDADDSASMTIDGLTITGTIAKDGETNEYIGGTWSYSGTDTIDWLVIKYGTNFGVYEITAGDTSGVWSINDLEAYLDDDASGAKIKKDGSINFSSISHATAYSSMTVVPLPAAGWLFLSGLVGLFTISRRKYANKAAAA